MTSGGFAAFAGGALAGVLASRALPPLFAQASGMARGAAGRDPFAVLAQDHRTILALLTAVAQAPRDAVATRTQQLLRLKRRLTAHALAEEDVIYPALLERCGDQPGAQQLYGEHAEMKIHLYELEEMPKDDPAWPSRVADLRALIETHVRQEEEVEFPRLRAALDDQMLARIFAKMQREKALLL
jgi:iron-sulfur cluster repair protein YtfE (RIC family)